MKSPQQEQWLKAMNREKACHLKNKTFSPEEGITQDVKSIACDWVFRIKYRGEPVEIETLEDIAFKARAVVKGQYMKEELQFNDTFAPVAKPATVRCLLAVAVRLKLKLKAGDIETVFLAAPMDCEVCVRMPPFMGTRQWASSPI